MGRPLGRLPQAECCCALRQLSFKHSVGEQDQVFAGDHLQVVFETRPPIVVVCGKKSKTCTCLRKYKKTVSRSAGHGFYSCLVLSDISNSNRKITAARDLVALIRKGQFEEFACLLESTNADWNTFVHGNTALHYCLMLGRDVAWCKMLVRNGANPNLSNQDGWHPIHLAAYCGQPEILSYLMKCNSRSVV